MRGRFIVGAVLAAALAAPQAARADVGSNCGGDAFTMCASWELLLNTATNTWTLTVNNTPDPYGGNAVITWIGLGTAEGGSFGTITFDPALNNGWTLGPINDGVFGDAGMLNLVFNAKSGGVPEGIGSTPMTFTFQTQYTPDVTQIGFHAQAGPNNCSTFAVFDSEGGANPTPIDPTKAANCGGTTVPEPATMALVGTGIAGILAARRRRRVTKA